MLMVSLGGWRGGVLEFGAKLEYSRVDSLAKRQNNPSLPHYEYQVVAALATKSI